MKREQFLFFFVLFSVCFVGVALKYLVEWHRFLDPELENEEKEDDVNKCVEWETDKRAWIE